VLLAAITPANVTFWPLVSIVMELVLLTILVE
jgi:hypothetical protein